MHKYPKKHESQQHQVLQRTSEWSKELQNEIKNISRALKIWRTRLTKEIWDQKLIHVNLRKKIFNKNWSSK